MSVEHVVFNIKDLYGCRQGILVTNMDDVVILADKQSEITLGQGIGKIVGSGLSEIFPETYAHIKQYLQDREKEGSSCIIADDDAGLLLDLCPVKDGTGIRGTMITLYNRNTCEDITLRLEHNKNLRRQLDAILTISNDGIWISDGKGMVLAISRASEKLNDIDARDFVGKNIQCIIDEGLIDRLATLEAIKKGKKSVVNQQVVKGNKKLVVTGVPLFDENGNIELVVALERDVTQLDAVQNKLKETLMVTENYRTRLAELSISELRNQEMVAESKKTRDVLRTALKLAHLNVSNILILGESGTGKGLLAKLIHKNSKRQDSPFIQINCAALPESLMEAELFGYEKGAFTGAREGGKIGLFELAHGGTLFLDEIGDLSFSLQAKLLKCLDDNEIMRLGGTTYKKIDCTIIAATNRDQKDLVLSKSFREDLLFRLNSFVISIPPLRERPEDLYALAGYFLDKYNKIYNVHKRISPKLIRSLSAHPFPGNVRELENIFKQAVALSDNDFVDEFIYASCNGEGMGLSNAFGDERQLNFRSYSDEMDYHEREMLKNALRHCKSTRELARYLEISQTSVVRKLKKHGLSPC
ncbi:MAG TPA: sigma 54-interacting transcriptional regulator [Syntrophales bacterium]|nr:sigma 54-interacting transcriptional regulator [Syntrophales bacterium]